MINSSVIPAYMVHTNGMVFYVFDGMISAYEKDGTLTTYTFEISNVGNIPILRSVSDGHIIEISPESAEIFRHAIFSILA